MSESSRQSYFYKVYSKIPKSAPGHEQLLLGSEFTGTMRFEQVVDAVTPLLKGTDKNDLIVDVGCGLGRYTEFLASLGHRVLGTDFCQKFVDSCSASAKSKNLNVDYKTGSFETLSELTEAKLGALITVGVLQNIDSVETTLSHCEKVIRNGGWICAETLNWYSLKRLINPKADQISAHYKPAQLTKSFRRAGFKNIQVRPVFILPTILFGVRKPVFKLAKIPLVSTLLLPFAHGLCVTATK